LVAKSNGNIEINYFFIFIFLFLIKGFQALVNFIIFNNLNSQLFIPILFSYGLIMRWIYKEKAIKWLKEISPERNAITKDLKIWIIPTEILLIGRLWFNWKMNMVIINFVYNVLSEIHSLKKIFNVLM